MYYSVAKIVQSSAHANKQTHTLFRKQFQETRCVHIGCRHAPAFAFYELLPDLAVLERTKQAHNLFVAYMDSPPIKPCKWLFYVKLVMMN